MDSTEDGDSALRFGKVKPCFLGEVILDVCLLAGL